MIKTIEKRYPCGNKFEMKQDSRCKCIIEVYKDSESIGIFYMSELPKMLKMREKDIYSKEKSLRRRLKNDKMSNKILQKPK